MQQPSSQWPQTVALVALAATLVACFGHFVSSFVYLPGADAYFYALQAQSVLDSGHLKVPDHGAVHYLIASVSRFGVSIETGFRIVLIGIFALYQLGMLLLVLLTNQKSQAVTALFWTLACPIVGFHAIEFPSLTLGLATLPFWFWLVPRPSRKSIFWLLALLTVAAWVHLAAAAIALLFAVTMAPGIARNKDAQQGNKFRNAALLFSVGVVIVIAAVVAFVSVKPRLTSFRPGLPGMLGLVTSFDVPRELKFTIASAWLLLAMMFMAYCKARPRRWTLPTVAALAIPLWPSEQTGLSAIGGRLSALFVLVALPLIVVLWSDLQESQSLFAPTVGGRTRGFIVAAVLIAVALLPIRIESYRTLLMADDYGAYENVVAELRDIDVPMLIAHRGLDFFYSYRLRRDAFHFDPEPSWNRGEIWRVAVRITPEEAAYYSPAACPWGQTARLIPGTNYLLVREDCWEQLRARVTRDENPDLYTEIWEDMENPSQVRPEFLRARHRELAPRTSPPQNQ